MNRITLRTLVLCLSAGFIVTAQESAVRPVSSSLVPTRAQIAQSQKPRVIQIPEKYNKLYKWSVAALVAGNVADVASSWGRPEANPILARNHSNFGGSALAVKSGITGGMLVFQYFMTKKHPETKKSFMWTNFVSAGILGGVAARNQSLGLKRN